MAEGYRRVRVEEVEWSGLLPLVRVFRSFRMAIHPAKLLLALLLVVLLYLSGKVLDAVWGPRVQPNEVEQYAAMSGPAFRVWRETASRGDRLEYAVEGLEEPGQPPIGLGEGPGRFGRAIEATQAYYARQIDRQRASPAGDRGVVERQVAQLRRERDRRIESILSVQPRGVFETALRYELNAFERLVGAASVLHFGAGALLRGGRPEPASVVGAVRDMLVVVPAWLYAAHRPFLAVYCVVALLLWSLLGGAIARMAALHATRDERLGLGPAFRFAFRRWPWYLLAPIIPCLVGLGLTLLLFLFGLVFFGLPYAHHVLDVAGGLFFVVAILLGLALSLLLVGLALSFNLLYPAVAVEGTDGFDANSRAFSYVIGRPWHLIAYQLVALVYGALTYLFFAAVIFLALFLAQAVVGLGASVLAGGELPPGRFDTILPPPDFGRLAYRVNWDDLSVSGKIAAVMTLVWSYLFIGLLAAYAISFYFCAQTWIYLLLRRGADGTEFDEVHAEPAAADDGGVEAPAAPAPAADSSIPAVAAAPSPEKMDRPDAGATGASAGSGKPSS